jgi:hypothetical protein
MLLTRRPDALLHVELANLFGSFWLLLEKRWLNYWSFRSITSNIIIIPNIISSIREMTKR